MYGGVGQQMICEFWGASNLDSVETTERALRDAVRAGGATLVEIFVHRFAPHGISGIAVIAESHLAVHTWPEMGYCAADFFTCGDTVDMNAIVATLRDAYEADRADVRTLARGVPPVDYELATFRDSEGHGPSVEYAVDTILEQRVTRHRELMLFESSDAGTVLTLDGTVCTTDLDSGAYYETLVQPAMHAHPAPRRIAIVGGIDLHALTEVLKHPVVEVHLLETDEETLRVAAKHYDHVQGSLDDPRVVLHTGAVVEMLETLTDIDVLIVDPIRRTDIPPAIAITELVRASNKALHHEGMFVMPVGTQTSDPLARAAAIKIINSEFVEAELLWTPSTAGIAALSLFTLATRGADSRNVRNPQRVDTSWYDPSTHAWSFLPAPQRSRVLGQTPAPASLRS